MPPLEPLNGSNYKMWKIRTEAILRAQGLWHTISPSDFSPAELAAAQRAKPLPEIPMPRIKLLDGTTGTNYHTWRKEVEGVLRILGLWDAVCPPAAVEAGDEKAAGDGKAAGDEQIGRGDKAAGESTPAPVSKGESRKSAWASVIIFDYCDEKSLSRILYEKDAAARWARLKTMYGPKLDRLLDRFWKYEAPSGMGVRGIARKLDEMQEDMGELCAAERPTNLSKTAVLLKTVERAREGRGEEERWATARFWIYQRKCGYDDAVKELVKCEKELDAEARKARVVAGGRRRNGKKV